MPAEWITPRKSTQTIASFSGMHHTDFTRPGEWYEMENLCDDNRPLLTPRRPRQVTLRVPGTATRFLHKNGLYYYAAQGGIFCHAPQGENPFAANGEQSVCIYPSEKNYAFIEMGNRILCVDTTDNLNHISIENNEVIELGTNANYTYRAYAHFSGEEDVREAVAYLNRHNVLYRSMSGDALKHLTQSGNKWYDAAAEELLNICFTYEVEREDGTRYIFGDLRNKYTPTAVHFAQSRYFLGTDNKFYYYEQASDSAYEIAAPNIAVFLRKGYQPEQAAYPSLQAGDYIRFSLGYSINYNHVSQDYHIYPTREEALMENLLLRVNRTVVCDAQTGAGWYAQGWEYCMVFDYSAELVQLLAKYDLFSNSTSYRELTDYTIPDPHADAGRQQVYPRYVKIENPFPQLCAPLEHNNRIWGADNVNNEIKASALGNYKNWDDYRGLASDSYAVSVGSDGAFTASCVLADVPYFFKEHSYTCVYGTRPANFCALTQKEVIGIAPSCADSLQVIGKFAYYMGIDGRIYRFNGSEAQCISAALGNKRFEVIAAAHTVRKYYLLVNEQGTRRLYVYSTDTAEWFCEDAHQMSTVFSLNANACALYTVSGANALTCSEIAVLDAWQPSAVQGDDVTWWCESGLLGFENDTYTYISNLKLRLESEVGARVDILAKYDNEPAYTHLATFISTSKAMKTEKISVRRCAFMRLKIRGHGRSKIYSVAYQMTQGSEK